MAKGRRSEQNVSLTQALNHCNQRRSPDGWLQIVGCMFRPDEQNRTVSTVPEMRCLCHLAHLRKNDI
jgi:hypothetical protein